MALYGSSRYDNSGLCTTSEGKRRGAQKLSRKGPFPGPGVSNTTSDSSSSDSEPQAALRVKREELPSTNDLSGQVVEMEVEDRDAGQQGKDASGVLPEENAEAGPGPSTQAKRRATVKRARSPSISPGIQSMYTRVSWRFSNLSIGQAARGNSKGVNSVSETQAPRKQGSGSDSDSSGSG